MARSPMRGALEFPAFKTSRAEELFREQEPLAFTREPQVHRTESKPARP